MGTEDWIFKGKKLITNTKGKKKKSKKQKIDNKKQRLKIQSRGWIFKNMILKKRRRRKQSHKNY